MISGTAEGFSQPEHVPIGRRALICSSSGPLAPIAVRSTDIFVADPLDLVAGKIRAATSNYMQVVSGRAGTAPDYRQPPGFVLYPVTKPPPIGAGLQLHGEIIADIEIGPQLISAQSYYFADHLFFPVLFLSVLIMSAYRDDYLNTHNTLHPPAPPPGSIVALPSRRCPTILGYRDLAAIW